MHRQSLAVQAPRGVFHWRGWFGILTIAPITVAVALSPVRFSDGTLPDWGLDFLGLLLLLTGILLRTWATLHVGGKKSVRLVQEGPYAICRNPLYLGSYCTGLAAAIFMQSLTLLTATAILPFIWYLPVVREEERILSENHPLEFAAYRASVPRFLPRRFPHGLASPMLEVSTKALRVHTKRTLTTLMIPPAIELLNILREQQVLPALLRLP